MQSHIADFLVRRSICMLAQPLQVAIYTRIAEGIRAGIFPPDISLPDEIEVGELLGVSRVAVREALSLLEEDGLIATRRGAGRYIVPRDAFIRWYTSAGLGDDLIERLYGEEASA